MQLSESVLADTLVLTVSATDRDDGLNGKVTYRLLSSPLQGFYIQPENGKYSLTDGKKHSAFLAENTFISVFLTANHLCVQDILCIETSVG